MERILVVDDEEGIRSFISKALTSKGLEITTAKDGEEASKLIERQSYHLLITDLKMPRLSGMELLRQVRSEQPEMEVLVLTAHGTVDSAVEAMKLGAFDYLEKPLSGPDELRLVVSRALERRRLKGEQQRTALPEDEVELIVQDPVMSQVAEQIRKVAATDATVLLTGESGTGKEVAARTIHRLSQRNGGPFIAVNCAALSENLLESEMFGHEKGAFTGASQQRRGRFELADLGTLFLDEVAELKPELQAKLLRVLQEHSFERVGGVRSIKVDVRMVAATNRDLGGELRAGRFREDLFHRLAVFPIHLPPLRERPLDLLPLAEHLLQRIGRQMKRPGLTLAEEAIRALRQHLWPGNIRELHNVLERAVIMTEGNTLRADHLALPATKPAPALLHGTLQDLEREAIRQALAEEGGHRKNVAARLGIGLRTLYDKIKQYGLE